MNTPRNHSPKSFWPQRLPGFIAAALLLRATWLPIIEIKGFDTFAFDSMALWATRSARVTLGIAILCLMLRSLTISRWWMALAVGILFSPLADMMVRAADLADMMKAEIQGDLKQLIVFRTGVWFCVAGLGFWLLDLVLACAGLSLTRRPSD